MDAAKVKLYSSVRVLSLSTDSSETWHKNVGKHLVRLNSRRPTSGKNKYTYLQFTKTLAEGKNRASFSERLNATVSTFELVIDKTHIGICTSSFTVLLKNYELLHNSWNEVMTLQNNYNQKFSTPSCLSVFMWCVLFTQIIIFQANNIRFYRVANKVIHFPEKYGVVVSNQNNT